MAYSRTIVGTITFMDNRQEYAIDNDVFATGTTMRSEVIDKMAVSNSNADVLFTDFASEDLCKMAGIR